MTSANPSLRIGKFLVREATPADPTTLGPRLRDADRQEIYAAAGLDGVTVLRNGLRDSRPAYAIEDANSNVLAMFGVIPHPQVEATGLVWLLGAEEPGSHWRALLRVSRTWVDALGRGYSRIGNYVDERNSAHVRWLRWCRFVIVERVATHGFEGRPFLRFERRFWRPLADTGD